MTVDYLLDKALSHDFLTAEEGLFLFEHAPVAQLMAVAHRLRKSITGNDSIVGWIIDRNVNITNFCVSQCEFCNFYRKLDAPDGYITSLDEYKLKVKELRNLGGDQLLLQGGLHPKLKLDFYETLFRSLKAIDADLKLHALGPAEIHYIAQLEKTDYKTVLTRLMAAGLDSLPGAGAEILSDRVRSTISKGKCTTQQWLSVMEVAHQLGLVTSATMMFGHIETLLERMEHLVKIREVQDKKPDNAPGFLSFIPWPFQDADTELRNRRGVRNNTTAEDYVRMIAISRIMLPNIINIQASWLTVGVPVAQITLHGGANDFGSIMIEENVVSAAGSSHSLDAKQIQDAIRDAGFIPKKRNQHFEYETTVKTNL